jgi:hypothetical protein
LIPSKLLLASYTNEVVDDDVSDDDGLTNRMGLFTGAVGSGAIPRNVYRKYIMFMFPLYNK